MFTALLAFWASCCYILSESWEIVSIQFLSVDGSGVIVGIFTQMWGQGCNSGSPAAPRCSGVSDFLLPWAWARFCPFPSPSFFTVYPTAPNNLPLQREAFANELSLCGGGGGGSSSFFSVNTGWNHLGKPVWQSGTNALCGLAASFFSYLCYLASSRHSGLSET